MTTTRTYKSTDSGAPTCTGQVGSITALIKTCLVGTSGVAYGSGVTEKLAAGWTVGFEDIPTNKLAVRNSMAAGGTGCYVRIYDNATGAAGAKEAYVRVYLTMSDIDTGTEATPTTAQMANGAVIRKSTTANSTTRAWILVADELTFTLHIISDPALIYEQSGYHCGDFESWIPGDNYRFLCMARNTENTTQGACGALRSNPVSTDTIATAFGYGLWLGRGLAGTGSAIPASIFSAYTGVGNGLGGSAQLFADSPPGIGGRIFVPAVIVNEFTTRGVMRGLFVPLGALSATSGDQDIGSFGRPSGSVLTILRIQSQQAAANYLGGLAVESALGW